LQTGLVVNRAQVLALQTTDPGVIQRALDLAGITPVTMTTRVALGDVRVVTVTVVDVPLDPDDDGGIPGGGGTSDCYVTF